MNKNEVVITTRDKLMRAWENSKELVRDFEVHSKEIEDENIKKVFKEFAEDEGLHAAKLRELLLEDQNNNRD